MQFPPPRNDNRRAGDAAVLCNPSPHDATDDTANIAPGIASDIEPDDCDAMWSLCLAVAQRRRQGVAPGAFLVDADGTVLDTDGSDRDARLVRQPGRGWLMKGNWSVAARSMFDLYQPLLELGNGQRYVIGHLGQSIDGRIATSSGDSCFINGRQNLIHMHRLRALCDAVLVGAATVVADDPQLTTRLVPGPHAARVVLDPSMRLTPSHRICSDDRSPTLLARYSPAVAGRTHPAPFPDVQSTQAYCGRAEIIAASRSAEGIDLASLLDALAARGLHAILVEGGGITVSRFLEQRLLNRLQIAIAPVIIGSGRHGLQLPEVLALSDCLRPSCRHHPMGDDMLWDLDMHIGSAPVEDSEPVPG